MKWTLINDTQPMNSVADNIFVGEYLFFTITIFSQPN